MIFQHFLKKSVGIFCAMLSVGLSLGALAEEPQPIGHFSAWRAYEAVVDGKKVCYMASSPLRTTKEREDVYLMVARHPQDHQLNVVSVMFGAPYHITSKPTLSVDNQKAITMFTNDKTAWIADENTEKTVVNKMADGNAVQTVGKSDRSVIIKDTYSLKGFTRALDAITQKCP